MSLHGGDQLASGAKSAQFSTQTDITEFENFFIFHTEEEVEKEYGLTSQQYYELKALREEGKPLPDLKTAKQLEEDLGFEVNDKRPNYLDRLSPVDKAAKEDAEDLKDPNTYGEPKCILDRLLVKRVLVNPYLKELEDGSAIDTRTGLVVAAKYRQHSNTGIVLAFGDFVCMGGVEHPLEGMVSIGDRVTFGDYNSEVFPMDEHMAEELCKRANIPFINDPESFRIIRIQDVRIIERREKETQ